MPRNSALQHAFKCVLENAVLNFGELVCTAHMLAGLNRVCDMIYIAN